MKLYKYKDIYALIATIGWLSFIFLAFNGFHFWYLGFTFFFWLCLGILNYRHESSLWVMKNRISRFIKYYAVLIILGFLADYFIGQHLTHLWIYPPYNSIADYLRLYLFIYPLGGLSVIELIYFLASLFKERVILIHNQDRKLNITKLEVTINVLLFVIIVINLFSITIHPLPYVRTTLAVLFVIWTIITTIKLKYEIKHWTHWVAILFSTLFISLFLHEIPNTAVYEWRYFPPTLFDFHILGLSIWVFFGWYLIILMMLKFWIKIVLLKNRE